MVSLKGLHVHVESKISYDTVAYIALHYLIKADCKQDLWCLKKVCMYMKGGGEILFNIVCNGNHASNANNFN